MDKAKAITTEQLDVVAQLAGGLGSSLAIIFWLCSWQLALVWAAAMPLLSVVTALEVAFMTGGAEESAKKRGKEETRRALAESSANKVVGEAVMGIRTVASFNLEQRFYTDYCAASAQIAAFGTSDAFVGAFFNGLTMVVFIGLLALTFYYALWLAGRGVIDFTAAIGPLFVITGAFVPMAKASALADVKAATVAASRLFRLFDRKPLVDSFDEGGEKPAACRGEVEVRDVVFAYPTAPDHPVCRGYSLRVAAGSTVALCGPSGSGKSTIIKLIERFYDPQSGVVLLDGADIRALNVRWLRAQLGLVGQEPVLFQGTVAQNIAYGAPTPPTQAEIEAAAKMANAHGFITDNLGDGYATEVGLKGCRLSGGQKQRVAIARALIKRPAVLLLDEATSALDNESERVVQAALDEVMAREKRTTLVIAHRLSTIRRADSIAVVYEGKILEQGTHDQLLANRNLYSNLVMADSGGAAA